MTRVQAEQLADAIRAYVDVMIVTAKDDDAVDSRRVLQTQKLVFEKMLAAFVQASSHG